MVMKGYIFLTIQFEKEGRKWVATCLELGTSTFGYTLKDAKTRINEAIILHLNTLEEVGERQRFFRENGIKLYKVKPEKKKIPKVAIPPSDNIYTQLSQIPLYA